MAGLVRKLPKIGFIALLALYLGVLILPARSASALSGSDFNPGHIIDDAIFTNANSMSVQSIQNFLNAKVPTCSTNHAGFTGGTGTVYNPPFVCLKDFYENPSSSYTVGFSYTDTNGNPQTGSRTYYNNNAYKVTALCPVYGGYSGTPTCGSGDYHNGLDHLIPTLQTSGLGTPSGAQSAAQIIYNAAQQYSINPQVLIVLLQKEQGLVTDDWPASYEYQEATGYGCPDTAPCSSNYAGFSNQVISAAWQFRQYLNYPNNYNYTVGNNYIQYNPDSRCGGTTVNIQNQATAALYDYTPYQPNSYAEGGGTSSAYPNCGAFGNLNFWSYFNNWFGNTILPTALKSSTSATVYIQTGGYKFAVPSMAMLQDYGISPGSVQTVDQSTIDAIPTPDSTTGLSQSLGYIVKSPSDTDADGGTVYVISAGHRYAFTSMTQFNGFGFTTQSIVYLPLNYIISLPDGGALSNYIATPTSNVFQVSNASKQIILDYPTYTSLNPSGNSSFVSTAFAATIPSGLPITNREILVGMTSGAVYLLDNNTYYTVPDMNTYNCWGFGSTLSTPLYKLADDTFVAAPNNPSVLGCRINTDQTTQYLLNGNSKILLPSSYGFSNSTVTPDLSALADQLPTRSASLARAVKSSDSSTIWYMDSGAKSPIPSMTDLGLLGISTSQVDTLVPGAAASLPTSGVKLGSGQVVMASGGNGTVYVVTGAQSRTAIASGDDFTAYGYKWTYIESLPGSTLDQSYPAGAGQTLNKYLYDQTSNTVYLMDSNGCHSLTSSQLTSYGQDQASIQAGQPYASTIFPYIKLSACTAASLYVKSSSQPAVYWLDAGTKHPISSWSKLVSLSGQSSPYIITLSDSTLNTFPTGSSL